MQQTIKRHYSTKKKNIILDILKTNQDHKLTADEIIHIINKEKYEISKATVYRNLDCLVSQGVICKFMLDNSCSCYIYKSGENTQSVNFCCDNCGEVVQIKSPYIERFNTKLQKEFDFTIDKSKTIIHGTCNKCKEHQND